MFFSIYLLINRKRDKTYVGFSNNINQRIQEHKKGKVKTTRFFDDFNWMVLEKTSNKKLAREAEKYWKSATGRRKIKEILEKYH